MTWRIHAKIGTHASEVLFARKLPRSKCPRGVNVKCKKGVWAEAGNWLEIKRTGDGEKWQGPLKLDEIRPTAGGTFTCDGLHIMHWI